MDLNQVQPRFTSQNWMGGDQLSITVKSPAKPLPGPQRSPVIPGSMRTVTDVTVPTGKNALDPLTQVINGTFATGPNAGVPISRVDISGFGESTFSDWHDPSNVPATISKVEFGVIEGSPWDALRAFEYWETSLYLVHCSYKNHFTKSTKVRVAEMSIQKDERSDW